MQHVTHYIENDCHVKRYICTVRPGSFGARLAEANDMRPLPDQTVFVKVIEDAKEGS